MWKTFSKLKKTPAKHHFADSDKMVHTTYTLSRQLKTCTKGNYMLCGVHNAEMKLIPAGVSRKSGKAYSEFYACQVEGCKWRPQEQAAGYQKFQQVGEQVAAKVAPEKAVMTKEDWEQKEQRTNRNILLQVAFKAAVEVVTAKEHFHDTMDGGVQNIYKHTMEFYSWLLDQTEGKKSSPQTKYEVLDNPEQVNKIISDIQADEVDPSLIEY